MEKIEKLPMSQRRYRRILGARCPFCNGTDCEGASVTTGEGGASQEMGCNDCGKEWTDLYELTGYMEN